MSESKITKQILDWLNDQPHCIAVKIHGGSMQGRGVPDILGSVWGRALALEVKTDTGTTTAIQRYYLDAFEQAGAIAAVVRSLADVQLLLQGEGL